MHLPETFLNSLTGIKGFDKEAFEKVHASGEQVTSIRINPAKQSKIQNLNSKVLWSQYGYYLSQRPSFTFDPLFHAGCYYVQEASSMLLEQALAQTVDLSQPLRILDLCAAPGGKSTHIQSLISKNSLLVSNEVIRSRANVLKDNIIKWGCENVVVSNNDPKDFTKLENYFDVILVDAPCSGSGLFRKEPAAIEEWSKNNVQLCSQRQQRILADVWPALKKDGILIYSTCSYSKEEDEEIVKWVMDNFFVEVRSLVVENSWGIIESGGGYRCWPGKVKGEGFFIACFQKKEGEKEPSVKNRNRPEQATKREIELIEKWAGNEGIEFVKHINTVYAWSGQHINDFSFLLGQLRVIYSGILLGELMRDKLVPGHPLAMSHVVSDSVQRLELDYDQSIQYLQRKELKLPTKDKGWQLVSYQGNSLGWVNILPNRINNYYPKELRILKDS